ncbi:SseB family protein [Actinomadura macrotermitis]|uniref:SseB family protein n=1 Tax=Actinomadura macrotermitis TaxID=2585200 RepID=UPI001886514C|nr:SseB family protein [Actinomadura macrotermitis]
MATVADAWRPTSELERRLQETVRTGDPEGYFRLLADSELVIPVPPDLIDDVLANEAQPTWPVQEEEGRTYVLAYTSAAAMRACLGPAYRHFVRLKFGDLAETWPDPRWWLAVDVPVRGVPDAVPLPIEGRLPTWYLKQLAEGDAKPPQAGLPALLAPQGPAAGLSAYNGVSGGAPLAPPAASAHPDALGPAGEDVRDLVGGGTPGDVPDEGITTGASALPADGAPEPYGPTTPPPYAPSAPLPGPAQPGAAFPAPDQPGAVPPAPAQPGAATPAPEHPDVAYPAPDQPGGATSAPERPDAAYPTPEQPGEVPSAPAQPGGATPHPDVAYPAPDQLGAAYPAPEQPVADPSAPAQPSAPLPGPAQPGAAYPAPDQLGSAFPTSDQPGAVPPAPAQPGGVTSAPERPGATFPTPDQPGGATPAPEHPDVAYPAPDQSGAVPSAPAQPGGVTSAPEQPGTTYPTPEQPGAVPPAPAQPGAATPAPERPGAAFADPDQPGTATPGLDQPSSAFPAPEQPGPITAGPDQPGGALPGLQHPGADFPAPTQPGAVPPAPAQPGEAASGPAQPNGTIPGSEQSSAAFAAPEQPSGATSASAGEAAPGSERPDSPFPAPEQEGATPAGSEQAGLPYDVPPARPDASLNGASAYPPPPVSPDTTVEDLAAHLPGGLPPAPAPESEEAPPSGPDVHVAGASALPGGPAPADAGGDPNVTAPELDVQAIAEQTGETGWEELHDQHRELPRTEPRPEFQPANDVERGLLRAAVADDHDLFLQTLADAEVLLPVPEEMDYTLRPGRPGFPWQTREVDGALTVPVFTSPERLVEAAQAAGTGTEFINLPFTTVLRYWPDHAWLLAINSGSPAGGTIQADQLPGLATWADQRAARRMAEDFEPQNEVEQRLFDAALRRDTDAFFKVLLGAQVLVPAEPETPWGIEPADPEFPWRPVPVHGRPAIQVFTSLRWMNDSIGSSRFVMPSFLEVVAAWPDADWTLVLNPGTPIDAAMPAEQIHALSGPSEPAEPEVPAEPIAAAVAADAPTVPQPVREPEFEPGNRIDQELYEAALAGDSDAFLRVLLAANVLVPIPQDAPLEVTPVQREFRWDAALRDDAAVRVFTSLVRLREVLPESRFVYADFRELIGSWPREEWAMLLNPGTRIGASLRGDQVRALSEWAVRVGLVQPRPEAPPMPPPHLPPEPVAEPQPVPEPEAQPVAEAPAARPAPYPDLPEPEGEPVPQPAIMQKVVPHGHVGWYLEQGYDRVGGFVHPTSDVAELQTPAQLYETLGLLYEDSAFAPSDEGVYVIRWPAYCPGLYRIPFGGRSEEELAAWGEAGWVIEREPFAGSGFAPGSAGSIREYKVDSVRLPYGAEMYYLGKDRSERFIAMYDPDRLAWLRPEGEDAGSAERTEAAQ